MNHFTVAFFGHRRLDEFSPTERKLEKLIRGLLIDKAFITFLVGRNGDFDQLVSSTIRRCKKTVRDDNSSLVWVMPYLSAEYRKNETAFHDYYDEIEICEKSAKGHFRAAHQIRNREIVDRADLIVFYVETQKGGAYQTMCYTKKQGKEYINLAFDERNENSHHSMG